MSHGAPDLVISRHPAVSALRDLGRRFPNPRAILVVSAHWISDPVAVTAADRLTTIHDFAGFPAQLYQLTYPAHGDRQLAGEIVDSLRSASICAELEPDRGLDHGAWTPLHLMYPDAEVPVVQVALPAGGFAASVGLGEALAALRQKDILIIGSGGSVHNLRALNRNNATASWARDFEDWLLQSIEGGHLERLIREDSFPPVFRTAHPTIEHFLPLIVAWAAAGSESPGVRLHQGFMYGNVGLSTYQFG